MPGALRFFSLRCGSRAEPAAVNASWSFDADNVREHHPGGVEGRCWLNTSDGNTPFPPSVSLQVGFFPSECVELINDKVPQSVTNSVPKPGV